MEVQKITNAQSESHNILVIESVDGLSEVSRDGMVMKYKGTLRTYIKFIDLTLGLEVGRLTMKSECSGYDAIEAVKGAIQNFMDGRFYRNVELKANHFDCIIHNRINSLEVQIPEPFKTLFLELFDVQKSQIPQKKLV